MKLGLAFALLGAACFCLSMNAQATSFVVQQNNSIIVNGLTGDSAVVEGNGKTVSEVRTIGAVTEAKIDGAFHVTIALGQGASLVLEADENILPLIKTEVSGERLRIFPDGSFSTRTAVKVKLSLPKLFALSTAGSSTIAASGFDQESFEIHLSGSSKVTLAGKVHTFAGTLSGAGNLNAEPLDADAVSIDISGAGRCSTTAHRSVAAEVSGAGVIAVHGNPRQRSTHVTGAGRVAFMN